MDILLNRMWYTPRSCCGQLEVDDLTLFTLELPVRDGLPGSAIPPGRFPIRMLSSPKFMHAGLSDKWIEQFALLMPHIICPPRTEIMIHFGNEPENTHGCVLVGMTHEPDYIGDSRKAFAALYDKLFHPAMIGDCWIVIEGGIPTPLIQT